ncbi:MAG: hypothetical protein D5S00_06120 [Tindallia sp. MSAO_Bac2]|nr:MAG: hypothetical protein D5S00_06120 [Tindallia sp. MSAO_Bac2]
MNLSEKKKKVLIGALIGIGSALMIAMASMGGYAYWLTNQPQIYPSVYIAGIDVSGMLPQEAISHLEKEMKPKLEAKELVLSLDEKEWVYPYLELGYHFNYEEAVMKAMGLGRQGNMVENALQIHRMKDQVKNIDLEEQFDIQLVDDLLDDLERELAIEGVPASLKRESGEFIISAEKVGREMKRGETRDAILDVLKNGDNETVEIKVETLPVYPTEADFKAMDGVIGEFSTRFNSGDAGRTANLRQGSGSINGTLLLPGEQFSFNETTGPRIASAGYQEAPVIIQGELVPGIGGGICQVSTTLYNAVVRANLDILERRNHSLPVAYVNLGHDATVAFGAIDFRFKNNYDYPIYLESYVSGNQLYARIFGNTRELEQTITMASHVTEVIEPEIEKKEDPEMYEGEQIVEQEPKKGYRVVTYKIYYENGQEVQREEISRDYYQPVKGITLIGTKPRPLFEYPENDEMNGNFHEHNRHEHNQPDSDEGLEN